MKERELGLLEDTCSEIIRIDKPLCGALEKQKPQMTQPTEMAQGQRFLLFVLFILSCFPNHRLLGFKGVSG